MIHQRERPCLQCLLHFASPWLVVGSQTIAVHSQKSEIGKVRDLGMPADIMGILLDLYCPSGAFYTYMCLLIMGHSA